MCQWHCVSESDSWHPLRRISKHLKITTSIHFTVSSLPLTWVIPSSSSALLIHQYYLALTKVISGFRLTSEKFEPRSLVHSAVGSPRRFTTRTRRKRRCTSISSQMGAHRSRRPATIDRMSRPPICTICDPLAVSFRIVPVIGRASQNAQLTGYPKRTQPLRNTSKPVNNPL